MNCVEAALVESIEQGRPPYHLGALDYFRPVEGRVLYADQLLFVAVGQWNFVRHFEHVSFLAEAELLLEMPIQVEVAALNVGRPTRQVRRRRRPVHALNQTGEDDEPQSKLGNHVVEFDVALAVVGVAHGGVGWKVLIEQFKEARGSVLLVDLESQLE